LPSTRPAPSTTDRGVESAHAFGGLLDRRGDAILAGDVHALVARSRTQLSDRRRALFVVDVEQGDAGAVCDKMPGHGKAESGNAAADDGLDVIQLHE